MPIDRTKLIQLIHVAKSKLGYSDNDYRALLEGVTGKLSCKQMTVAELDSVIKAFKSLGFTSKKLPVKKTDVGSASREQIYYIKGMWELVSREKTEKSLQVFCKRITGVSALRFLTPPAAMRLITALRTMMVKAGYNPDAPEHNGQIGGGNDGKGKNAPS